MAVVKDALIHGNTRKRVLFVNIPRLASRAPRPQPIQASRAAHFHAAEPTSAQPTGRPARVAYQVPQVLAHRVAAAQVVIAAAQAVEQPQVFRTRFDDTLGKRPQVSPKRIFSRLP
jgi:hypothetical protein